MLQKMIPKIPPVYTSKAVRGKNPHTASKIVGFQNLRDYSPKLQK